MGCFTTIGRVLLIIFNLIFLIVSLAILAAGVLLKFFPGKIFSHMLAVMKAVDVVKLPPGADSIDFVPMLNSVGVALIVFGCILLSISFFACCGACCKWRLLLILFAILMLLLIIIQTIVGGLFIAKDSVLNKSLKDSLANEVKTKYKGPANRDDIFSMIVNMLSYSLECCGFKDYTDFDNSSWDMYTYSKSGTLVSNFTAAVTITCCKKSYLDKTKPDPTCAQHPLDISKIYETGCYDKMFEMIEDNKTWVVLTFVLLLLLQVAEVIVAIVMVKQIGDNKVGPI